MQNVVAWKCAASQEERLLSVTDILLDGRLLKWMVDEQRRELEAAMQARIATNRTTSEEVFKIQAELAAVKVETAAAKELFVAKCKEYDDDIRYIPS